MPKSNIRRRIPRRARKTKMRVMRRGRKSASGNQPEWASLSETVQVLDNNNQQTVGTIYNNIDVQLAAFARASAVAQGYQYFRITRVTYKYKPLIDTFIATAPGATQVPYLYWVINKTGLEYPGLNLGWFLANGAKPIRFDDKTITISYAPAVSYSMLEAATPSPVQQPNQARTKQWMNTASDAFNVAAFSPSTVSHAGHYHLVDSQGSTQAMKYEVTCTAEFQFKKPNARVPTSEPALEVVKSQMGRV